MIPDFLISKYFSFFEATDTRKDVYLMKNEAYAVPVLYVMTNFFREIVDEAREALGGPTNVSSGFRCLELNAVLGGVSDSKHTTGEAADIFQYGWDWAKTQVAARRIYDHFKAKGLNADIIAEQRPDGAVWIHVERNDTLRLWTAINKVYSQVNLA